MEFNTCVKRDRAVRSYTDEPVSEDDIRFLIDIARRSGSGKNRQPWSFVVVRERERLKTLAALGDYTTPLQRAPVGIVLLVDRRKEDGDLDFNEFDCGRAYQNLTLAATDRGLGTVPQSIRNQKKAKELLNVPEDKEVFIAVAVGHPAETRYKTIEGVDAAEVLLETDRSAVDSLTHWETHR